LTDVALGAAKLCDAILPDADLTDAKLEDLIWPAGWILERDD
jgi:hypothetical protein